MRREFVKKKKSTKKNAARSNWQRNTFIVVIAIAVFCSIGFYFSKYQKHTRTYAYISHSYLGMKLWLENHHVRENLNDGLVKLKQLTAKEEIDRPVHFEFYTALPDMHIPAEPAISKEDDIAKIEPAKIAEPAKIMEKPLPIADASELEKGMAEEFKQAGTYLIQLGIFKSPDSVSRLRQAISKIGLDMHVVKCNVAQKEMYRVQLGPYANKEAAKLALRQLQKKGINGILRKD